MNQRRNVIMPLLIFGLMVVFFIAIETSAPLKEPLFSKAALAHVSASKLEVPTVERAWIDRFDDASLPSSRWDWAYIQEPAYFDFVETPEWESVLEVGVSKEANEDAYADGSLREQENSYGSGTFEARLRLSDDNGFAGGGAGTRGWGFWDGNLNTLNVAWFWSASPESHDDVEGFRVMVIRNGVFILNEEIPFDMREWHTYRVELSSSGTKFFVDGKLIASTPGQPANLEQEEQRIELWLDNMEIQVKSDMTGYERSFLDLTQDQKMWIDWVSYTPIGWYTHKLYLPILN
jgi:hypothetical protein